MGIANTDPAIKMNAQFAPIEPLPGRVGSCPRAVPWAWRLDHANRLGLGLSTFVSVGNKADLSVTTSSATGRRTARRTSSSCTWSRWATHADSHGSHGASLDTSRIVVKSGRLSAGARATSSHTGALLGASDVTVDALFRQAGVLRTDTLAELFDVTSLLANQPIPAGPRVAILMNGGGPGILAADACEAAGLEVPPLPDDVRERLAEWLPAVAGIGNPVDMIASATADDYRRAIELLATQAKVDALTAIFAPPLVTRAEDVATAIREAAAGLTRPVPILAVFLSAGAAPAELRGTATTVPAYTYPENAAHALERAVRYGQWRARPEGVVPSFPDVRAGRGGRAGRRDAGRRPVTLAGPDRGPHAQPPRVAAGRGGFVTTPTSAGEAATSGSQPPRASRPASSTRATSSVRLGLTTRESGRGGGTRDR